MKGGWSREKLTVPKIGARRRAVQKGELRQWAAAPWRAFASDREGDSTQSMRAPENLREFHVFQAPSMDVETAIAEHATPLRADRLGTIPGIEPKCWPGLVLPGTGMQRSKSCV